MYVCACGSNHVRSEVASVCHGEEELGFRSMHSDISKLRLYLKFGLAREHLNDTKHH